MNVFIFQDYEVCPGNIIPAAMMQYLFSKLPSGEKGDSRFVKTIAVRVWGSNHLASHTVAGRKDPKLVKKDPSKAEENMRGALDEARLFAVQGEPALLGERAFTCTSKKKVHT